MLLTWILLLLTAAAMIALATCLVTWIRKTPYESCPAPEALNAQPCEFR